MRGDGILSGTRALVIGGSNGIGLATARLLAIDGCRVTIAGRKEQQLVDALRTLAGEGLVVHPCPCDTLSALDVADAVAVAAEGESLEIAVTVPGAGTPGRLVELDPEQFSADVDHNVRPVFVLIKYAVPAMPPGGSIVAVSSTAVVASARGLASHKAGKAAVDALVEAAADELGEEGIRINSVRPGITASGPGGLVVDDETAERVRADQPLTRSGEIEDIALAIRFLAGPESSWVTGQHLTVDGGHVLRAFPDLRPPRAPGDVAIDLADEVGDLDPSAPAPAPTA